MAKLNKYLIGDSQTATLQDRIEIISNGVDLNIYGYDTRDSKDITCWGKDAVLNRALFWLTSKSDDFVRNPGHGGALYNLLGTNMTEENLSAWEGAIKTQFNAEFDSELTLMYLNLDADTTTRKIVINMVVQDAVAKRNYQFSVETQIG